MDDKEKAEMYRKQLRVANASNGRLKKKVKELEIEVEKLKKENDYLLSVR